MDISIGAVGAAIVAAAASLIGLILGKEQKTSEFRQEWINKLRDEIALYLVSVNTIVDKVNLSYANDDAKIAALSEVYAVLNKANFGIILRVNYREIDASNLLKAMADFESLFSDDSKINQVNVKPIQDRFILASQSLLKKEWSRVKRGESTFVGSKYVAMIGLISMILLALYLMIMPKIEIGKIDNEGSTRGEACIPAEVNCGMSPARADNNNPS